ncbi:hypothetical protein RKD31_000893 [Streptomyces sp. SAI-163]|jgi:hypothetical protein
MYVQSISNLANERRERGQTELPVGKEAHRSSRKKVAG